MDSLSRLLDLCPPPSGPGRAESAAHHGEGNAIRIAADHQALIDRYGPGNFDDFIAVFSVRCENRHLDIEAMTASSVEILAGKEIPKLRAALAGFGSRPEDLVQWGGTDNADSLFWVPVGSPDRWPTIIVATGQLDFLISPENSTSVLFDLLSGSLHCPFFPDDFPSEFPAFEGLA